MELRDAIDNAVAAARASGGEFRQLVPVYANRAGLALQVMRGEDLRRTGRTIAITAIAATITGGVIAIMAERLLAHRGSGVTDSATSDTETPTTNEAAFTG